MAENSCRDCRSTRPRRRAIRPGTHKINRLRCSLLDHCATERRLRHCSALLLPSLLRFARPSATYVTCVEASLEKRETANVRQITNFARARVKRIGLVLYGNQQRVRARLSRFVRSFVHHVATIGATPSLPKRMSNRGFMQAAMANLLAKDDRVAM